MSYYTVMVLVYGMSGCFSASRLSLFYLSAAAALRAFRPEREPTADGEASPFLCVCVHTRLVCVCTHPGLGRAAAPFSPTSLAISRLEESIRIRMFTIRSSSRARRSDPAGKPERPMFLRVHSCVLVVPRTLFYIGSTH